MCRTVEIAQYINNEKGVGYYSSGCVADYLGFLGRFQRRFVELKRNILCINVDQGVMRVLTFSASVQTLTTFEEMSRTKTVHTEIICFDGGHHLVSR